MDSPALAIGLTVAVQVVHSLGVEQLVRAAFAHVEGDSVGTLFVSAATGAVLSNLINNIPAYLLLEPAAASGAALIALLIGSNAGPIVTPWASLATLLWADQLRRAGHIVPWRQFAAWGYHWRSVQSRCPWPRCRCPSGDPAAYTRWSESGNHLEIQPFACAR